VGQAEVGVPVVEVDDGQAPALELFRQLRSGGTADDAVSGPVEQPIRRRSVELAFVKKDGPAAVGIEVARDSPEDLTSVDDGSLYDKRNVGSCGRTIALFPDPGASGSF
jgi:hypothetical protein